MQRRVFLMVLQLLMFLLADCQTGKVIHKTITVNLFSNAEEYRGILHSINDRLDSVILNTLATSKGISPFGSYDIGAIEFQKPISTVTTAENTIKWENSYRISDLLNKAIIDDCNGFLKSGVFARLTADQKK